MVSRNLNRAHLFEVGLTEIPGDHETLFIVHHVELHVGLHVDFHPQIFLWAFRPLGLHLHV